MGPCSQGNPLSCESVLRLSMPNVGPLSLRRLAQVCVVFSDAERPGRWLSRLGRVIG